MTKGINELIHWILAKNHQGAEELFMNSQQVKHQKISPEKKITFLINKPTKKNTSMMMQQKQMFEEVYSINQNLMYMAGFYDCHAKACTLVRETERIFVVHQSPLEILEYSIKKVGYNLKGAMETS